MSRGEARLSQGEQARWDKVRERLRASEDRRRRTKLKADCQAFWRGTRITAKDILPAE